MSYNEKATGNGKEKATVKKIKLQQPDPSLSNVKCLVWNVTSMINKTPEIMEHVVDRDPSIVMLQETWLKTNRSNVTALVKEYGYILLHNIRKDREKAGGGGVGILLKRDMKFKRIKHGQFSSFEHKVVKVSIQNNRSLLVISIYRVLFVPVTVFLEEIVELFEYLTSQKDDILLAGDVNIHMDTDELYSNKFRDILRNFNITQHVHFPTHIQGHTLDIIATFGDTPTVSMVEASEYDISHHHLIDFQIAVRSEMKEVKQVMSRNLKGIEMESFMEEVKERILITEQDFGKNMRRYNETIGQLVDMKAPLQNRSITVVPSAPWFDNEYKELRAQRRKAEKKFNKTKMKEDKEAFIKLRKQTTQLAHQKKCKHYGDKLEGNNHLMFRTINKLLDDEQEEVLPEAKTNEELANRFLKYFSEKIEKIRSTFPKGKLASTVKMPAPAGKLLRFRETTEEEIREIVNDYGVKCSPEDPAPASLLKKVDLDVFIPIWTKLVNLSLEEGAWNV